MKKISVLGSTGSIGINTLKVVEQFPDRFTVLSLVAGTNLKLLAEQAKQFKPEVVSIAHEADLPALRSLLPDTKIALTHGATGAAEAATLPALDTVVSAISGGAGLIPTAAAVSAGKHIALANKETLVMAGGFITREAERNHVTILPVDSEHSALFQCLKGTHEQQEVKRLVLTASGGPFLNRSDLDGVSVDEALAHPTWKMGRKISIDSATLMNKGLEIIEARWLFDIPASKLGVLVHPQSIVHSLVEFVDGAYLAHLGVADMRVPIQYALSYPKRLAGNLPSLDLATVGTLTFQDVDHKKFPAVSLAYNALESGEYAPLVLNAANEVAVQLFLEEKIAFCAITQLVQEVLEHHVSSGSLEELDQVLAADQEARAKTKELAPRFYQ